MFLLPQVDSELHDFAVQTLILQRSPVGVDARQRRPYYIVISSGFPESSIAILVYTRTTVYTHNDNIRLRIITVVSIYYISIAPLAAAPVHIICVYIIYLAIKMPCTTAIHSYIYI